MESIDNLASSSAEDDTLALWLRGSRVQPPSLTQTGEKTEESSRFGGKFIARLIARIDRSAGPDGCHPWTGFRDSDGYGRVHVPGIGGRPVSRVVLELKLGRSLLPGMKSLHSCDNPPCANPVHLSEGTQAENIAERDERGRTQKGARHYKAVLTEDQVVAVFRRCLAGESHAAIARDIGVGSKCISHIAHGTNWKHVTSGIAPSPIGGAP